MKTELGRKSITGMILMIVESGLAILVSTAMLIVGDEKFMWLAWMLMMFGGPFLIFITLPVILAPRILLTFDGFGVYLYTITRKEIYIPYKAIRDVKRNGISKAGWRPSFGTLIIKTPEGELTVRAVEEADKVQKAILNLTFVYNKLTSEKSGLPDWRNPK